MGEAQGDSSNANEQLHATKVERDRALDELKEMKMVAQQATLRLSDALISQPEICPELDSITDALSTAKQELQIKEKNIKSLKSEADRAKQMEAKLEEKDALVGKLRDEVQILKTNEPCADSRDARIQELEQELEKRKESETKLLDSFITQTKQLEQTKISLEESKLVIASLSKKMENSDSPHSIDHQNILSTIDELENLRSELQLTKENLVHAEENEKIASLRVHSLVNELKMVSEAEENNKKAMDDLALALKEVATEANEAKESLDLSKKEAEKAKSEVTQLKFLLKSMQNRCRTLLEESRKETEMHKNTCERLRLEAEESLVAWNEKETMFVKCIKTAEEDNAALERENSRLIDALKEAKKKINTSKDENKKLRDILKQALNEANVAKEAAGIARQENSQLKDSIAEKESALEILSREIENLRNNEALAYDNIKELKRLLREVETPRNGYRSQFSMEKEPRDFKNSVENDQEEPKDAAKSKKMERNNSLKPEEAKAATNNGRDGERVSKDLLKGSIFDSRDSPRATSSPQHKKSFSLPVAEERAEDSENEEDMEQYEQENDKNARKRRPLLRRFGNMLVRKSFIRREPVVES